MRDQHRHVMQVAPLERHQLLIHVRGHGRAPHAFYNLNTQLVGVVSQQ